MNDEKCPNCGAEATDKTWQDCPIYICGTFHKTGRPAGLVESEACRSNQIAAERDALQATVARMHRTDDDVPVVAMKDVVWQLASDGHPIVATYRSTAHNLNIPCYSTKAAALATKTETDPPKDA